MAYNLDEIPDLTADIAQALGVDLGGLTPVAAAEAGIKQMKKLLASVGIPASLKAAGIDKTQLDACAELSLSDGSIIYNAKMIFEPEEVRRIYQEAY
jgi:alcohol dehydrogenase class IV